MKVGEKFAHIDREEYLKDTSTPICIYNQKHADIYHRLEEEDKIAWNRYAQGEADKWNEKVSYDKTTDLYYQWMPNLTIEEWLKRR